MLSFARLHIADGVAADGRRLLDGKSIRAMQQFNAAIPGQSWEGRGLGWALSQWGEATVLQHDGGTIGQAAALRVLPGPGVAFHLSANGGNWTAFRDAVLAEVVPDIAGVTPPPRPAPTDSPTTTPHTDVVGVYRNIGAELTVTEEQGQLLMLQRHLDPLQALASDDATQPSPLVPHGEDRFLASTPDGASWIPIAFVRDENGRVKYLHAAGRAARRTSG